MSIQITPLIDRAHLEEIINMLPEPQSINVFLAGGINYGEIGKQVNVPDLKIRYAKADEGVAYFALENPSRRILIDLIRQENKRDKRDMSPHAQFYSASFREGDSVVDLTPTRIGASYRGKEPALVTRIRQKSEELEIPLTIKANQHY